MIDRKTCANCGTALHKERVHITGLWYDYCDSPNEKPHTHDRCRWQQAEQSLLAAKEELVTARRYFYCGLWLG